MAKSVIKPPLYQVTQTGTTGATGNIVLSKGNSIMVRATGKVCIPFTSYTGDPNYVKILDSNTLEPVVNEEVEVTAYYAR